MQAKSSPAAAASKEFIDALRCALPSCLPARLPSTMELSLFPPVLISDSSVLLFVCHPCVCTAVFVPYAYSDTLRTSIKVTRQSWGAMVLSGMATSMEDESFKTNCHVLPKLRTMHFNNRHHSWFLLQEIIRIDNDPTHIYHQQASVQIKKLLDR
jgi:hypothetical protein